MLQNLRDTITGWIAGVILGLLIIPFAFWGVDSYFTGAFATWAAKVDGVEVENQTLQREYQSRLLRMQQIWGDAFDPAFLDEDGLRQASLDALIRDTALSTRIIDDRYEVSDEELTERVRQIPQFQVGGEFDLEAYRRFLRVQGMSPAQFEDRYRLDLAKQQLADAIVGSAFVLEQEARTAEALRGEQRTMSWIHLRNDHFVPSIVVSDEDVLAHYEANSDRYMTAETVDIVYLTVAAEMLRGSVEYSEEELREYYQDQAEQTLAPERRRARHILINADDASMPAASAQISELRARVEGGEDFATLAQQHSQDAGSAASGGDLGWMESEMLVGAFRDELFAMEAGELRGPVETEFGSHLILLEEIEAPAALSFEEVRYDVELEFADYRAREAYYDLRERLAELVFENPSSLDPAAEALGLELQAYNGLTRAGGDFGVASAREVVEEAFREEVVELGENSDPIELPGDRVVALRVTGHAPSVVRPFEEVAEAVRRDLILQRADELAAAEAERVAAAMGEGQDPETLAADVGATIVGPLTVGRSGSNLTPQVAAAVFEAPRPAEGEVWHGVVPLFEGYGAVVVSEVISVDPADQSDDAVLSRRTAMDARIGTSDYVAYGDDLVDAAEVEIREGALDGS